jgi:hypothetical protein
VARLTDEVLILCLNVLAESSDPAQAARWVDTIQEQLATLAGYPGRPGGDPTAGGGAAGIAAAIERLLEDDRR